MRTLTYTRPHRLAKLLDELIAANIPTLAPIGTGRDREAVFTISSDGATVTLVVPDNADEPAITAVVNAHDATTPGIGEIALTNERTLDQRLAEQLPVLRAAIDQITASPPTLFAGLNNQERVFLRRLARNQSDLIRLVLRLLESTE